ncbi:hypothetical protein ES705_03150 [subsurface metagenome]|jgi:hypothetical protein|nr:MAG: hypothetical protein CEE42_04460 [Candidatus Lokiarchaeota archaeon Loki_b31]
MEELTFRNDETPYLVFACKKCRQYSYVKIVQKTKKCLRCGRTHQVKDILSLGEIVYGMTAAVDTVKQKQSELSVPEFRSESDFVVATNNFKDRATEPKSKRITLSEKNNDEDKSYEVKFKEMLLKLSNLYGKFPMYMLKIMAENYGIPTSKLTELVRGSKKAGLLTVSKDENYYYKLNKKRLSFTL